MSANLVSCMYQRLVSFDRFFVHLTISLSEQARASLRQNGDTVGLRMESLGCVRQFVLREAMNLNKKATATFAAAACNFHSAQIAIQIESHLPFANSFSISSSICFSASSLTPTVVNRIFPSPSIRISVGMPGTLYELARSSPPRRHV